MKRILAIISMLAMLSVCMAPGLPWKAGETYYSVFQLSDTAGVAAWTAATPTVDVFANGALSTSWLVTCGTAEATKTGAMKLTSTAAIPAYATGTVVSLRVTATVGTQVSSQVKDEFVIGGTPVTFGTGDGQVNARSGMVQTGSWAAITISGNHPINVGTGAGQLNAQGGMVNTGSIYNVQQTGTDLQSAIAGISTAVQLGVASTLLANGTTVTTGSNISGTYGSTWYSNNQYWVTAPVAEGLDAYLTYTASANQYINSVTVRGYFNAAPTRYLDISASNCQGTGWDQLSDATTRMNNASTNQNYTYPLSSRNQGPNGEVRLRFSSTSSTLTDRLYVDQAIVGIGTAGPSTADIATAVYNRLLSVVYEGGITIDTEGGTDGTVLGTNGTIINPVKTYSSACTLAANLGVKRFYLKPDSDITLTQAHDYWRFIGKGKIHLGGMSANDLRIESAELVDGTATGDDIDIHDSVIGSIALSAPAFFERCALTSSVSLASSGNFTFHNCYDANPAGTGATPCLVFTDSTASVAFRDYRGGIDLALMTSGNALKADGAIRLNAFNGCTGGDVTIRGFAPVISGTAATLLTITQGQRYGTDQLLTPGVGTGQLNVLGGTLAGGVNMTQLGGTAVSSMLSDGLLKVAADTISGKALQFDPNDVPYVSVYSWGAAGNIVNDDYVLTVTDIQTIAQHQTKSGGRVWYVSPAGAGAGSTLGDPGSLAVAATACSSGDTIFLTAGTYTTTLSISGKANLDIRGAGAGATVVTATCATTGWEFTNCPDIRVADVSLTFTDPVIGERPVVTALGFVNCDRLTLERARITSNDVGVSCGSNTGDATVRDCYIDGPEYALSFNSLNAGYNRGRATAERCWIRSVGWPWCAVTGITVCAAIRSCGNVR